MTPNPIFDREIEWMDDYFQNPFSERKWEDKLMRAVQCSGQTLEQYCQELVSYALRAYPAQKQCEHRLDKNTISRNT